MIPQGQSCHPCNTDLATGLALMQSKDKIKRASIKSKSALLMISYRYIRNKIDKLNSELKSNTFLKNIFSKGNMRESWRIFKQVINKRSKSTKIDILKESGNEIVNKQDIANTMNSHFSNQDTAHA